MDGINIANICNTTSGKILTSLLETGTLHLPLPPHFNVGCGEKDLLEAPRILDTPGHSGIYIANTESSLQAHVTYPRNIEIGG